MHAGGPWEQGLCEADVGELEICCWGCRVRRSCSGTLLLGSFRLIGQPVRDHETF